jgi:hypothetical protein
VLRKALEGRGGFTVYNAQLLNILKTEKFLLIAEELS